MPTDPVEVLVIGAGATGAAFSWRLARAGVEVLCLDQGGWMNCYQICVDTCDAGDCVDTELGFKVCVVEEEA